MINSKYKALYGMIEDKKKSENQERKMSLVQQQRVYHNRVDERKNIRFGKSITRKINEDFLNPANKPFSQTLVEDEIADIDKSSTSSQLSSKHGRKQSSKTLPGENDEEEKQEEEMFAEQRRDFK